MKVRLPISEQEILSRRSPAGGWTRKQLAEWGISWPPRRGWKKRLMQSGRMVQQSKPKQKIAPQRVAIVNAFYASKRMDAEMAERVAREP